MGLCHRGPSDTMFTPHNALYHLTLLSLYLRLNSWQTTWTAKPNPITGLYAVFSAVWRRAELMVIYSNVHSAQYDSSNKSIKLQFPMSLQYFLFFLLLFLPFSSFSTGSLNFLFNSSLTAPFKFLAFPPCSLCSSNIEIQDVSNRKRKTFCWSTQRPMANVMHQN